MAGLDQFLNPILQGFCHFGFARAKAALKNQKGNRKSLIGLMFWGLGGLAKRNLGFIVWVSIIMMKNY